METKTKYVRLMIMTKPIKQIILLLLISLFSVVLGSCSEDSSSSALLSYQSLTVEEMNLNWAQELATDRETASSFDVSLEEIMHLLVDTGWAVIYPTVFGQSPGSEIADCMDTARGGQFTTIPSTYPAEAWYTYDDISCEYNCQVGEYIYWTSTSAFGAQNSPTRLQNIDDEWQLGTRAEVIASDNCAFSIISNETYKFPHAEAHFPDGNYSGVTLNLSNTFPESFPETLRSRITKSIYVFDIPIYAFTNVPDANLLHAAKVMAQYLDRNEDGTPDNQAVTDQIVESGASMLIFETREQAHNSDF